LDYDFSSSGAEWIWESYRVMHSVTGDIVNFERAFSIEGFPAKGTLHINCDNGYEAYLNNKFVGRAQLENGWQGSDLTESFVHTSGWQTVEHYDLSDLLLIGENVLEIAAANEYMGPLDNQNDGT